MISDQERERNLAAQFLPQRENDERSLPCIEIAGVQVYVYFDGGELRISAHYDTADEEVQTERRTVPTRISVGGEEVFAED